jgi:hypothetical protein
MSKDEDAPTPVRITNQFRKGQAMAYDLSCSTVRLTLEISARDSSDGRGEWRVSAYARQAPEKPALHEPGVTRADALRALAASWAAKEGAYGFPTLDWEGVTRAMLAVRAI